MHIKTIYSPMPIPYRDNDWCAYDDATYDGEPGHPVGWGRTEADAVADLKQKMDCEECGGSGEILHRGYGGAPQNDYAKPCADCKGTGRHNSKRGKQ